jgi:hypothetical protein
MSPVKYELGFYIPEDDILYSHRRENLKPYMLLGYLTTLFCVPNISCHLIKLPDRKRLNRGDCSQFKVTVIFKV